MHIVRISCRGFKTYRDLVSVDTLDGSNLNCIVGLNGSGKSSLFHGLVFVLSPHLNASTYLHEGSGGRSTAGFVEVEISNRDKTSFPIDSDTVILRRSIVSSAQEMSSSRPSEFSVNGKDVSRLDYISLLQTAGLIGDVPTTGRKRKNRFQGIPFYIVEQGRVAGLATVSDEDRFELLKEAAGLDVFAEKKDDSVAILEETREKRVRVDELLVEIESKCGELEKESKELGDFSRLRREKSVAEYQLVSAEMAQLTSAKDSAVGELQSVQEEQHILESELAQIDANEISLDAELQKVSAEDAAVAEEKRVSEEKVRERKNALSSLVNEIGEVDAWLGGKGEKEKTEIRGLIDTHMERRDELARCVEADSAALAERRAELSRLEAEKIELNDRLTCVQSGSLSQRQEQLELVHASVTRRMGVLAKEIEEKRSELEGLVTEGIPAKQRELEKVTGELAGLDAQLLEFESQQARLTEQQRGMNNELFVRKQKTAQLNRTVVKLETEFREVSGSVLRRSNINTRDLVARSDIPGVRGLFGDSLRIPSAYRVAVDSSSRNVLFNVVIDSDEVADVVVGKLAGGRGRVTLVAINRASGGSEADSAKVLAESLAAAKLNAQLLSSVITPRADLPDSDKEWVGKLIVKSFARTAVVDTIDTGVEVAKRFRIDCVTIEGDTVSKDLVVRGGSATGNAWSGQKHVVVKNWQQSLELKKQIGVLRSELKVEEAAVLALESDLRGLDRELAVVVGDRSGKASSLSSERDEVRKNVGVVSKQVAELEERRVRLERSEIPRLVDVELKSAEAELRRIAGEVEDVRTRIAQSGSQELSQSDRVVEQERITAQLAHVNTQVDHLAKDINSMGKRVNANMSEKTHFVEARIQHLQEVFLEKEREVLHQQRKRVKLADQLHQIEDVELPAFTAELAEVVEKANALVNTKVALVAEREAVEVRKSEIGEKVSVCKSALIRIEGRITETTSQILQLAESLRSFSSVPAGERLTGDAASVRALRARIVELNAELNSSKFNYLNKRSVEQFERVSSERQSLLARKFEIDRSFDAINEFLQKLTVEQERIIAESFTRVKDAFKVLFARVTDSSLNAADLVLTPAGGLSVQVTFPISSVGEEEVKLRPKHMHELSGGQRTVVALCFLFALREASPVSRNGFFVLDEVDAALDSNYRAAIADLMVDASQRGTQFLFTSFRPEFCSVATKHLMVSMLNGTSRVESVDLTQAMNLVGSEEFTSGVPALGAPEIEVRE